MMHPRRMRSVLIKSDLRDLFGLVRGGKLRRQGQTNLHRSLSQYYVSRTVQGELSIVHPVIVSEKLDNINNRQRKQILKSFFY